MLGILQNTIIFVNNDEDEDMDGACHIIKLKIRVLHQIMYFNMFTMAGCVHAIFKF